MHRLCGFVLNAKPKRCGKPQRSQYAQCVLGKSCICIAHASDNAVFHILCTAEKVNNLTVGIAGDGVHRKVTPFQVLVQRL